MSQPEEPQTSASWDGLDLWAKAAAWQGAPETADMILELAKENLRSREERAKRQEEFERDHKSKVELHRQRMDVRLWKTQLVGVVGSFFSIGGLIAVAWRYAEIGNPTPGLAIFGLGGSLVAGLVGTQRLLEKRTNAKSRELDK